MQALFHHACRVEEENGRYRPYRFTEEQLAALGKLLPAFEKNGRCAAGISMKFRTDADEISFSYEYTVFYTKTGGFDIYENGEMTETRALPERSEQGRFVYRKRAKGACEIEIFLPANAEMTLWDFELGNWHAVSAPRGKIIFYGDSLTQSAYTTTPSLSFATITAGLLEKDYCNRGIGSLFYNASYLIEDGEAADTVFVQFGGNDLIAHTATNKVVMEGGSMRYRTADEIPQVTAAAREYLARIKALYPGARLFVSTRIPHAEVLTGERKRANDAFDCAITEIAEELGFVLIPGAGVMPGISTGRVADGAHFDALGGALAAISLAKKMKNSVDKQPKE